MRWLLPPATRIAESTFKRVARLQGYIVGSSENSALNFVTPVTFSLLRQLSCHFRAKRFAIGATAYLRPQRFHHRAHLRFGCGAEFSNGFAHDSRQFVRAHPLWQISVQNRQLLFFLVSQFSADAFFKTFDRILALLSLLCDDLNGFSVTALCLPARFCARRAFQ